ncbi:Holliday junction branch migration protein RuvA [Chloroflexus sp.]|uniref:Holliday junction branch migration protein RuvA n=1 Tax=Chloroflexus sp. TaxID=1904827 RepID=UPI002604DAE1|nr:Holliday junction branch migration protein RuvA [uncultured Chloroflexus sp.]
MIASIRGIIQSIGSDHLVVETGGVGFLIYAPRTTLAAAGAVGSEAFLHTTLIAREDALTLYGFSDLAQRSLFEQLIGVSGVGPKLALSLLSSGSPDEVRAMIAGGDITRLSRVPGIGKKTAERIVLELRGKIDLRQPTSAVSSSVASIDRELSDILVSLGYSAAEAAAAIAALPPDAPAALEERLRLALRYFGSA